MRNRTAIRLILVGLSLGFLWVPSPRSQASQCGALFSESNGTASLDSLEISHAQYLPPTSSNRSLSWTALRPDRFRFAGLITQTLAASDSSNRFYLIIIGPAQVQF